MTAKDFFIDGMPCAYKNKGVYGFGFITDVWDENNDVLVCIEPVYNPHNSKKPDDITVNVEDIEVYW